LLILFWLLTIIVPYLTAPARPARAAGGSFGRYPSRRPDRQAM
jgi:hypothetical protein